MTFIDGKASRPTTALSLGNCSLSATTLSYLSSRAQRGTCSAPFGRPTFTHSPRLSFLFIGSEAEGPAVLFTSNQSQPEAPPSPLLSPRFLRLRGSKKNTSQIGLALMRRSPNQRSATRSAVPYKNPMNEGFRACVRTRRQIAELKQACRAGTKRQPSPEGLGDRYARLWSAGGAALHTSAF